MSERTQNLEDGPSDADPRVLGVRLRTGRLRRQLSVRELARRAGVSASLVSQIENGRVRPSVSSLLALVGELDLSLDKVFSAEEPDEAALGGDAPDGRSMCLPVEDVRALPDFGSAALPGSTVSEQTPLRSMGSASSAEPALVELDLIAAALPSLSVGGLHVEHPGTRAVLELDSGVIWERLTAQSLPGMEFLYVRYNIGASSTPAGRHTRHQGIEFGYMTRGTLHVTLGFDEFECPAGTSVTFDAATPHRLENRGDVPAEAVWLILGRRSLLGPSSQ